MIPFSRTDHDTVVATFTRAESELLAALSVQLTELLSELAGTGAEPLPGLTIGGSSAIPADPALARLFPDAYADEEQSRQFRELTERGLANRKLENARAIVAALGPAGGEVELDTSQALAWARSITDIRLSIAARLGIEDELYLDDGSDETRSMLDVYDWLAAVQDSLVRVM
jgi:hypothetical protein